MYQGLACFDLDGTLILGTTSAAHLARSLGHEAELTAREAAYAEGKFTNHDVAAFDAWHYRGRTVHDVQELLESAPIILGINEVVQELHARNFVSIIATVAWRFVAEWFCQKYSFDGSCGPEIDINAEGIFTGCVRRHFDEWDKLRYVRDSANLFGIPLDRCTAIGDGRSDIPVFGIVGHSIALNAVPAAQRAAYVSVRTRDLRDILPFIGWPSKPG
jgi:phosphoserine phosphatase